jgi:hypothetical protein
LELPPQFAKVTNNDQNAVDCGGRVNEFEVLSLPPRLTDVDELQRAYRQQRTMWFMRQFVPEYMTLAAKMLEQIEDAYSKLRDPRQQRAILRTIGEIAAPLPNIRAKTSKPAQVEPAQANVLIVSRPKITLEITRAAEALLGGDRTTLSDADQMSLVRKAMSLGLDYADAADLVRQTVQRLLAEYSAKRRFRSLLRGFGSKPPDTG